MNDKIIVKATGTTLGADDGFGIAFALSYIYDKTIKSGAIEVLLTDNEETTMSGASGLQTGLLKSKYLINLDSGYIGLITIGCVGGFASSFTIPPQQTQTLQGTAYQLSINGLSGGHSGIDIHLWRANGIILLTRLLDAVLENNGQISEAHGGSAGNAIPMDASATVVIPNGKEGIFEE